MLRTHTAMVQLLSMGACLAAFGPADAVLAKPNTKPSPPAHAGQPKAAAATDTPQPSEPAAAPDPKADSAGVAAPAATAETTPEGSSAAADAAATASRDAHDERRKPLEAERLSTLRSQASALIDEMAQARAKAALLGKTLFRTQLRLRVQNLAAPDPRLTKIVLKLDGAPVFTDDGAAMSGDDAQQVFEGLIAPGSHVLTAELQQQSRTDSSFGYVLHDSYRFKARSDKLSELTLIIDDDSDLASEYPDDGDGEYDVRLKLRVRTKDLGED